ncbi:MAG: reactive intermediate/imine deaminase [Anaerolineae bacterium]|nr:MAG: reactive intermediate/imine deaminase [Anaerolineae bacterium]
MPIKKEVIIPAGGAKPLAPYSPGIRAGQFVYTAGQVGLDPATQKLVEGGVQAQARQSLENVKRILEAAGSSLAQVVKTTVFMTEMSNYGPINEIYGQYFTENPPARSAVAVKELPAGALVEIEAVALVTES